MKHNMRTTNKASHSAVMGIGIGIAVAMVISSLLSIGLTSLVLQGSVSEVNSNVYIFVIRMLSVLFGCLIGTHIIQGKCLLVAGSVTGGYLAILLGIGIAFFDGTFHNFGSGLVSVLAGGIIVCLLKLKPSEKKKRMPLRKLR